MSARLARDVFGLLASILIGVSVQAQSTTSRVPSSLSEAIAQLKIPPAWFEATPVHWDTNKPWAEARLEIRRLLGQEESSIREAVKLTWLYAQKGDIGNGHELSMYLFMSGNYAWAAVEFPKHLLSVKGEGATHAYLSYASCLEHFGEYEKALTTLKQAFEDLPAPPWRIASLANIHNHLGDFYVRIGNYEKAKGSYQEAIRLYPTSDQPYGRHLLPRYVAKIRSKLDLMTMQSLSTAPLRNGTYTGKSLGYADTKDLEVKITVNSGKISDVQVKHEEKIELNATEIVPKRIVAQQSLLVDGVTGATVTSQAIIDAALQALRQAGAK